MANPFFSGRIPPGLADKIDAHLLTTGETRSELLIRLLRVEISDNKYDVINDNVSNNKDNNVLLELITRVEKLEQIINNKRDNIYTNRAFQLNDDKLDNTKMDSSFNQDWIDVSTLASLLQIKPKSITNAASKRGRNLSNDTLEFEIAGKTIQKKGSRFTALYRLIPLD